MFHPSTQTLLFIDFIFAILLGITLIKAIPLYKTWDIHSTSQLQYNNEKTSFLLATVIKYLLFFKIPLFIFFVFTLDKLSINFIGAMCAAGVVDNLDFGSSLLLFKLVNLFLLGFWVILHYKDIEDENLPYSKTKFGYFIVIGLLILLELILEFYTLLSIDTTQIVQCCGTIFSKASTSYIGYLFLIDDAIYVAFFYSIYFLMLMSFLLKKRFLFAIFNVIFLIIALISLILFFGTYIYELPTHHCPFCFLQKEYFYVGYLLYFLLFLGSFLGIASELKDYSKSSIILNSIYLLIVTYYVVGYYIRNGVWL